VLLSFGLKAAGWLGGVLDALDGIVLARNGLPVDSMIIGEFGDCRRTGDP